MAEQRNLAGKRVRVARQRATPPLTQADLSARLAVEGVRVGRIAISKIEGGTRTVTDVELRALARALGTTVAWLLEGADHD